MPHPSSLGGMAYIWGTVPPASVIWEHGKHLRDSAPSLSLRHLGAWQTYGGQCPCLTVEQLLFSMREADAPLF